MIEVNATLSLNLNQKNVISIFYYFFSIKLFNILGVQKLLKIRKITYKEFELIPLLPDSEQLMKKEKTITYVYTDTYKYPFYLLTLNKEFLRNFKDELNKIDAKINQMDKNNIVIEKLIRHYDDKLNLDFPKFIDYFEKKYFSKLEIKNIDDNLWPKTRSKAIDLCKQNDRVSLIYRNKPENYLRIDGEIKAIEEVSKNLNCFLKEQNI